MLRFGILQKECYTNIGEPVRSELAKKEYIDLDYLNAHILKIRKEKKALGLLIHRLRMHDDAPKLNRYGHLVGCDCMECQSLKYGLYSGSD